MPVTFRPPGGSKSRGVIPTFTATGSEMSTRKTRRSTRETSSGLLPKTLVLISSFHSHPPSLFLSENCVRILSLGKIHNANSGIMKTITRSSSPYLWFSFMGADFFAYFLFEAREDQMLPFLSFFLRLICLSTAVTCHQIAKLSMLAACTLRGLLPLAMSALLFVLKRRPGCFQTSTATSYVTNQISFFPIRMCCLFFLCKTLASRLSFFAHNKPWR